jgi:uncharacterized membrane protein
LGRDQRLRISIGPDIFTGAIVLLADIRLASLKLAPVFVQMELAARIACTFIGGQLLGLVPSGVLLPLEAVILLISAYKVCGNINGRNKRSRTWRWQNPDDDRRRWRRAAPW